VTSAGSTTSVAALTQARRSFITRTGEQALREELDRRRHQLEIGFAERLRDARGFGEAAGNDEYLQIKEEETVLAAGIARLEELLASATVVDEVDVENGVASIGTVVVVSDRDSGVVDEHLLVGGYEPLAANTVSANSPIGQALMGRRAGEDVEVQLPRERTRRLRVLAVRPPG
jgi:transcription elongation factor GreA